MREYQIVVYGSYGFTGKLIIEECLKSKLKVLLAGRDSSKLESQSFDTGYTFEAVDIDDTEALQRVVGKAQVLIHCAGPFKHTALKMARACLATGTHYTDITGEFEVFEMLSQLDNDAKNAGVVIMPGTGFDVVPSDCLALHLKNRLPSATHLQLAFAMTNGGVSRGTARTMIEGLGHGSMVRHDGKLKPIPLGKQMNVNFGPFTRTSMCIPWGDISTAWRSTRIPDIEVYSAIPANLIRIAHYTKYINGLLKLQWIKNLLRKRVDARGSGPQSERMQEGKVYLRGMARDNNTQVEAIMTTPNGYLLTAQTATLISSRLLAVNKGGYFTPAEYFGANFILEIFGTSRKDLT